jgi:hypothetical protein
VLLLSDRNCAADPVLVTLGFLEYGNSEVRARLPAYDDINADFGKEGNAS